MPTCLSNRPNRASETEKDVPRTQNKEPSYSPPGYSTEFDETSICNFVKPPVSSRDRAGRPVPFFRVFRSIAAGLNLNFTIFEDLVAPRFITSLRARRNSLVTHGKLRSYRIVIFVSANRVSSKVLYVTITDTLSSSDSGRRSF